MEEGGALLSSWLCQVKVCPEQPPDAVSADQTAKLVHLAYGVSAGADLFLLKHLVSKENASVSVLKQDVFADPRTLVDVVLAGDPRVVGIGNMFARHPASKFVVLAGRSVELSAQLTEQETEQLGLLLQKEPSATVKQLADQFPAFGECFGQAMDLVSRAKAQGRDACCLSNGHLGFCVLIRDSDASLYACTSRSSSLYSDETESLLMAAFGLGKDDLPSCWESGSRSSSTLLHPHPTTGLWPRCIFGMDQPYGSVQLDPDAHGIVRKYWQSVLANIPSKFGDTNLVELVAAPLAPLAPPRRSSTRVEAAAASKKRTEQEEAAKRGPGRPKKKKDKKEEIVDTFQDVKDLVGKYGWTVDQSSLGKKLAGKSMVTVRATGRFTCVHPKHVGPRDGQTFIVDVHRDTGGAIPKCKMPSCRSGDDHVWSAAPGVPGTLAADPLFEAVKSQNALKNHAEIAKAIAPEVKQRLAYDASSLQSNKWRVYGAKAGTWKASSGSQAKMIVHGIIVARLQQLAATATAMAKSLPPDSKAQLAAESHAKRLTLQRQEAGSDILLGHFCVLLEHCAAVDKEMWKSHFSGYLPVSNVLLHFCTRTGRVTAHEYKPEQYIRQEYQATFVVWNPDAPVHHGLDKLLESWWGDEDGRRSWLHFLVYGLSRTGFAEKLFILFGPGGSAKSSVTGLMEHWYGSANVSTQASAAFLVQKGNVGSGGARDDDGTGHNSTALSFCDKALVGFPEAPQNGRWRDEVVKRITGDKQGGRHAHSKDVLDVARTFLAFVVCNSLPRPSSVQEIDTLIGRLELVVSTNVFFRNEAHERELQARMTPDQREMCVMKQADSTVVDSIKADPAAATHFLNLLAASWTTLIVAQKRMFVASALGKKIMANYWQSLRSEDDSVVSFLSSQVQYVRDGVVPKINLWHAYSAWYKEHSSVQGSPGPLVTSDISFYKRVSTYFQHQHAVTCGQPNAPVMVASGEGKLTLKPTKKVHSYLGIALKRHSAYPSPPDAGLSSASAESKKR
jgi:hypothetical protein